MENKNQPAFPVTEQEYDEYGKPTNSWTTGGLTKREYFAVKVLQGLLAGSHTQGSSIDDDIRLCMEYTDKLLNQLEA